MATPVDIPIIPLPGPLQLAMLALDILEWLGVIPDPISLIISLFQGRPKPEATAQVADWLMKSTNAASRIWGVEIARYLVETGAVLSDGHPAVQQIFFNFRQQFVKNMEAQGVSNLRANQIADIAYSRQSQAGGPYPAELQKQIPPGYQLGGPQTILDLWNTGLQKGTAQGFSGNRLNRFATQWVLEHVDLLQLWKVKIGNVQGCIDIGGTWDWTTNTCQTTPPPLPCPPGTHWDQASQSCVPDVPPGGCPPGMHFDPGTGKCVPDLPGPQTCQPWEHWDSTLQQCVPNIIPSPLTPFDPDADELEVCCQETQAALATITAILGTIAQELAGGSTNPDPNCCANVVTQLTQIVTAIANVANNLGVTIDLSGIDADLQSIAAALGKIQGVDPAKLDAIATAIKDGDASIAKAISNAPGVDMQPVVDALNRIFTTLDPPKEVYTWLEQNGYIDAQVAQLAGAGSLGAGLVTVIENWLHKALAAWLKFCGVDMSGARPKVLPLSLTLANDFEAMLTTALGAGAVPVYPVVKGLIDAVVGILTPTAPTTIANVNVDQDLLLSKTLAPILIINGVALVADFLGWEISEQLKEYVDRAAEFLGLAEIAELKVGARLRAGPMKEAELQAKAIFRQELPGVGTLASWHARALIPDARYKGLLPLTGLPGELEAPETEAAFHGWSPRMLIRATESGLFTNADLVDELTFSGMRQASQHRYLTAAPWLATQTYRHQLISSIEKAYVAGIFDDATLTAQIDSANQNTDRDSLVLTRGRLEKLIVETKALETEYTTMFLGNVIDDVTYRANLQGIGLQPDMVNIQAGRAEAKAQATLQRKLEQAIAADVRRTQAVARQAAVKNFMEGNIDVALLTTALIGTGLTPVQAASWADLAVLRKAGSPRWLYGLQLSPPQALLLRQRVTALTDQRKKLLLTDAQYVAALQALGIPPKEVNALRAAADATVSPKTAATLIAVQTN